MPSKTVLTTLITKSFLPGLRVLLRSLIDNSEISTSVPFIVYVDGDIDRADIESLRSVWPTLQARSVDDLGRIPQSLIKKAGYRYATGLRKLLLFAAPYSHMVFLDADLLCLDKCRELIDVDDLGVSVDYEYLDRWPCRDALFSSGVMCFQPNPDRLYWSIEVYSRNDREYRYGDQDALNFAIRENEPQSINWISPRYNMHKRALAESQALVDKYGCALLHYAGVKPWQEGAYHENESPFHSLVDLWYEYAARDLYSRL